MSLFQEMWYYYESFFYFFFFFGYFLLDYASLHLLYYSASIHLLPDFPNLY